MRPLTVLVGVSASLALASCGNASPEGPSAAERAHATLELVNGIPQDGIVLGSRKAPATLTAYVSVAELNAGFLRGDLPKLVTRFVRPGKLRIELRTLTEYDDPTVDAQALRRLTRVAQAAALQNHLWDFYLTFDAVTGGSFDPAKEGAALSLVPAVDAEALGRDARGKRVARAIGTANAMAEDAGVKNLPAFVLRQSGRREVVDDDCLDCLVRAVASALVEPAASPTPKHKHKHKRKHKGKAKKHRPKHHRSRHHERTATPAPAPVTPAPTAAPRPTSAPQPRPAPKPKPRSTPRPKHTPYPKIPAKPEPKGTPYPRIRPTPTP